MTNTLIPRYQKARSGCVLFHLEKWAAVRLSGPDAREFLQRMSTQDLRNLSVGQGLQSLLLKGDGRIVADCAVLCEATDTFLLLAPEACRQPLLEQLDRFHFSENFSTSDLSSESYPGMLAGPRSAEYASVMAKIFQETNEQFSAAEVEFAPHSPRLVFRVPAAAFQTYSSRLYTALEDSGGVVGGEDLFACLRVEEGIPLFGEDLDEKTIPLEAGLKPAISFTKGCFPGQEIVARINNLGHPANVLVGLRLPETVESLTGRDLISEDKVIGRITSAAFSPALGGMLGLGFVKWSQREVGTVLKIPDIPETSAVVVEVPLAGLATS